MNKTQSSKADDKPQTQTWVGYIVGVDDGGPYEVMGDPSEPDDSPLAAFAYMYGFWNEVQPVDHMHIRVWEGDDYAYAWAPTDPYRLASMSNQPDIELSDNDIYLHNRTVERFNTIRRKYAERFKQGENYYRALWDTIMDASHCVGKFDWKGADHWLDQFEAIVDTYGLGVTVKGDRIGDNYRVRALHRGEPIPANVLTHGDLEDWRRAEYVRLNSRPGGES